MEALLVFLFFVIYATISNYINKMITKKINKINELMNETIVSTLEIIHADVSNSVRNMIINQFQIIRKDIESPKMNIFFLRKLNYHIDTINRQKANIKNDILKINKASSFILNEKEYISNLNKSFVDAKKQLTVLLKKYDVTVVNKHLKNFTNDKKYYTENFISIISKYFKKANNSLIKLNLSDALYNIEKINDLTKIYYFEISSVSELSERLEIAYNNYKMYDDEVKTGKGSLYNKIITKIHRLKNRNSDIVELWNDIIRNIDIYNIIDDNDYISKSNRLALIISELRKIDMLLDAELELEKEKELVAIVAVA